MTWHNGPLVAFDTETTGVDPETARIVTATVLYIDGREVTEHSWLVDPGVDIPDEAAAIHGITTEKARADGMDPQQAVREIDGALQLAWGLGRPVIAYNACYDLTLLDRELRRHHDEALDPGHVVDPLVIDRKMDKYRKGGRKLVDACRVYGVTLSEEDAHTSRADALAAARVAWVLANRYPTIRAMELGDLHNGQVAWYAEWAGLFQAYLRTKKGQPDAVIAPDWPVVPYVPQQLALDAEKVATS